VLAAQRRDLILQAVRSDRGVQVGSLAERFGVSEITVRRDLTYLARAGKVTRVHGGAVGEPGADGPVAGPAVAGPAGGRGETAARQADARQAAARQAAARQAAARQEAKQRVGRAAAALVEDGQTVMLDIGSTALEVARALRGRRLTVITGSLAAMEELLPDPGIELVLLGGVVRRDYRSMVGALAEDALHQLSADVAFLGASSLRRRDLSVMDTTTVEVPIKRGMLAAADRSVLLIDAAKLSARGTVRICAIGDVDAVVTDAPAADPLLTQIRRAGVELVAAVPGPESLPP
jgi:DeoR/GlpR family transcriptional regulator of sugar metabolism